MNRQTTTHTVVARESPTCEEEAHTFHRIMVYQMCPLDWSVIKTTSVPIQSPSALTWSLTMMGVLTAVPTRLAVMMSKSASVGAAELQTGTLVMGMV